MMNSPSVSPPLNFGRKRRMKFAWDVISYATFRTVGYSPSEHQFQSGGDRRLACAFLQQSVHWQSWSALARAAFFFGGYYSVAGTTDDPAAVTWALTRVRTASINRHANDNPPASFGDAAMVQAGAKAYASFGCANLPRRARRYVAEVLGGTTSRSARPEERSPVGSPLPNCSG